MNNGLNVPMDPAWVGVKPYRLHSNIYKYVANKVGWKALAEDTNEGLFLNVALFHAEVLNGGLMQYFTNSSGREYRRMIKGLEVAGLHSVRDIVCTWINILPSDIDPDDRYRVLDYMCLDQSRIDRSQILSLQYYSILDEYYQRMNAWALGS